MIVYRVPFFYVCQRYYWVRTKAEAKKTQKELETTYGRENVDDWEEYPLSTTIS